MTTATGDTVYDFKGLADQANYVPPGMTVVTGGFDIASGALIPRSDATADFIIQTNSDPAGDIVRVTMEANFPSGTGSLPCLLWIGDNAYSNGYLWSIVNSNSYVRVRTGGVNSGSFNPVVGTYVVGTTFSLEYQISTGRLEAFQNGVSVGEITSTAHTTSLGAGFYADDDPAANGIASFATTGYSVASTPTLTTTLVADAADTALPASTSVNVTVFTLAWVLVGTGTKSTTGAISITDADLTLEAGQSITDATAYWVNYQEAAGTRQRTVKLTAAV